MHVIHLGQCPAHSKHSENASYYERLMWHLGISQHQGRSTIVVLSDCITSASADEHFEVFSALWQMERSDRTCQKVEPRDGNGPLAFSLLIWQTWDTKRQLKIESIFISSAQLAIKSYLKMFNKSNSSPASLNCNNKKHEHLLKPNPWSSRSVDFMFPCSESSCLRTQTTLWFY